MPATSRPRRQRDLVRTFTAISTALNLKQPLTTTLDLIAEQVARTLGHRFCAIALHEQATGSFRVSGSYGLSQEYLDAVNAQLDEQIARHGLDGAPSPTVRVFRSRMPLHVDDITTDLAFAEWRRLAEIVGYTSAIFFPLVFRDESIGVLSCYDRERVYDGADVDAVRIVAEQTATAVGIAGLLDRQQHAIEALRQTTRELDDRNRMLRHTADATRTLTDLLLRHCTLEELLGELNHRLGSPVVLYDAEMRLLAAAGPDAANTAPHGVVVPVDGAETTYGHLAVGAAKGAAAESETPLLEQAAMACALYFMREQAAAERELRVTSQLLNDLLTGDDLIGESAAVAARLHLDEGRPYRIVAVVPVRGGVDTAAARRQVQAVTAALGRLGEVAGGRQPTVYAVLGDDVVAIVPATSSPEQLAHTVWTALADAPVVGDLEVGISRPCTRAGNFRGRYRELRKCQELASQSGAGSGARTVLAEQWHVHTMLMRTADDEEVRDRAHQLLDPVLADGDDRLLASLRVHLASHASATRTATALHVHPNTVKYRLRKIERMTGLDTRELPHLLELHVALAVHDLDPARFVAEARR